MLTLSSRNSFSDQAHFFSLLILEVKIYFLTDICMRIHLIFFLTYSNKSTIDKKFYLKPKGNLDLKHLSS